MKHFNGHLFLQRIGRTGRGGKEGTAISYLTRRDCVHADKLIEILEGAKQIVPDELRDMRSGRR